MLAKSRVTGMDPACLVLPSKVETQTHLPRGCSPELGRTPTRWPCGQLGSCSAKLQRFILLHRCKILRSGQPVTSARNATHPEILTFHGSPPCVRTTSSLFFEPSFLNSDSTYAMTRSVVFLMVRSGTNRMENFPLTEQGMTVLDPGAAADELYLLTDWTNLQKAPSIPCSDRLGFPAGQLPSQGALNTHAFVP